MASHSNFDFSANKKINCWYQDFLIREIISSVKVDTILTYDRDHQSSLGISEAALGAFCLSERSKKFGIVWGSGSEVGLRFCNYRLVHSENLKFRLSVKDGVPEVTRSYFKVIFPSLFEIFTTGTDLFTSTFRWFYNLFRWISFRIIFAFILTTLIYIQHSKDQLERDFINPTRNKLYRKGNKISISFKPKCILTRFQNFKFVIVIRKL